MQGMNETNKKEPLLSAQGHVMKHKTEIIPFQKLSLFTSAPSSPKSNARKALCQAGGVIYNRKGKFIQDVLP